MSEGQPKKDWIQTYTGRMFYPTHPRVDDIDPRDLAHHLSNITRYTGAVRQYSVAQHSCHVAVRAAQIVEKQGRSVGRLIYAAQYGLIHDASEAYIADVSRPVKHTPEMAAYRQIEANLMYCITRRFNINDVWTNHLQPPEVSQADLDIYETEKRDLIHNGPRKEWEQSKGVALKEWKIVPWTPEEAESCWLKLFDLLGMK